MECEVSEEVHPPLNTRSRWFTINLKLLPVKGFYFFMYAAIGDLLPFVTVYMRQQGLSTGEAGIIYGVMPFIAFLTCPLIGALADRIQRHKLVLIVCTALTGVLYSLLLVVPANAVQDVVKVRTNVHCNPQDSFVRDCVEYADKSESCYLTLSEYANLTRGGSTAPTSCTAECSFAEPGAYTSEVCFTKDAGSYEDKTKCIEVWISASSDEVVRFELSNVSEVIGHEIVRDAIDTPHLHCREYDLKHVSYGNTPYWQILCRSESILHCVLTCSHHVGSKCQPETQFTNSFSFTFWLFFVILLLANIVFAPVCNILDAVTYTILGKKHKAWGLQRLWGTTGFALFAVTSTFIMDSTSGPKQNIDYTISFYIFFALCMSAVICCCFIQFSTKLKCGSFIQNVFKLLSNPRIACFLVVVTLFGMFVGAIEGFLFWYLLNLGSSQIVLGLSLACNCVAELAFLFFSGRVIQRVGHVTCMHVAAVAFVVRFLSYSLLTEPWYVLLVEPVHGVTFALMWAAATSYASVIAPPGMAAVTQGLVGGLHFGFGKGTGSLLTGFLFEYLGEVWTFRLLAGMSLVVFVVYFVINITCLKGPIIRNSENCAVIENKDDYDDDSSALHDHLVSDGSGDSPTKLTSPTTDAEVNHTT